MKNVRYIFFSALAMALITTTGCQDVIEIELKDSDKQYVVDGTVIEGVDSALVIVSKTTSYFDTLGPEAVSNASVFLIMPDGSELSLPYTGNGKYVVHGVNAIADNTYGLRVEVDDRIFTSSCYMKPTLQLDSLDVVGDAGFFGSDSTYNVFLNFIDQPGKDYYRVVYIVDGELQNTSADIMIFDDNLNDGAQIRIPIFTYNFEVGDSVDVELQRLDDPLYEFYQTFANVSSDGAGNPFSAAPANPESNIEGGALGVFGAYTSSKRSIRVN